MQQLKQCTTKRGKKKLVTHLDGEYMEVKFQITATYEYDYLCF